LPSCVTVRVWPAIVNVTLQSPLTPLYADADLEVDSVIATEKIITVRTKIAFNILISPYKKLSTESKSAVYFRQQTAEAVSFVNEQKE